MKYFLKQIAEIIGCNVVGDDTNPVDFILIDSRLLKNAGNTLFFALTTKTNDGHLFIDSLIDSGVKSFVVDEKFDIGLRDKRASFIRVDNVLKALQMLSRCHRGFFNTDIIGITGSNGKTVVKEWLRNVLSYDYRVAATPKSYNSQIGVALSLWNLDSESEIGIFEAGISECGEMVFLAEMIKPKYGIFTNIGNAHNDGFKNIEEKIFEKLKLFKGCECVVVGSEYEEIFDVIEKYDYGSFVKKFFTFGPNERDDLRLVSVETNKFSSLLKFDYNSCCFEVIVPFIDKASIENIQAVIAMLLVLGYDFGMIAERVKRLEQVEMRLEVKEGLNGSIIINDSYSLDMDSLDIALDFMCNNYNGYKKSVILSDVVHAGVDDSVLYNDMILLLESKGVDKVFCIGKSFNSWFDNYNGIVLRFDSTEDFIRNYDFNSFDKEVILVKGKRSAHFEDIVWKLENKSHGTVLDVDLGALVHNFKYYKGLLDQSVKIGVMVKAFGYGAGSYEIARTLRFHNVDYFIVAYTDEAYELRDAGIDTPIMVMNPEYSSFYTMSKYDVEPEIYSFGILERLLHEIKDVNDVIKIHVKLDTGMHRLGFCADDLERFVEMVKQYDNVVIASVFSHLSSADDKNARDFTFEQIKMFKIMSDYICNSFDYKIIKHLANSSGISNYPEAHFDMVRMGIGLYGLPNDSDELFKVKPVSTLKSFISQIQYVFKGDCVGYGRKTVMNRDSKIAIVSVGYADGYLRFLGNGNGVMFVNGKFVRTVGNICMDMCMIDVTDVDCNEGDVVEIFGKNISVKGLAESIGTIGYEIIAGISRRVKRVYFND